MCQKLKKYEYKNTIFKGFLRLDGGTLNTIHCRDISKIYLRIKF